MLRCGANLHHLQTYWNTDTYIILHRIITHTSRETATLSCRIHNNNVILAHVKGLRLVALGRGLGAKGHGDRVTVSTCHPIFYVILYIYIIHLSYIYNTRKSITSKYRNSLMHVGSRFLFFRWITERCHLIHILARHASSVFACSKPEESSIFQE